MLENRTIYDNYGVCSVCGGSNDLAKKCYEQGCVSECETTCKVCGFKNYWAYGWYQCDGNEM